LDKFIGDGVLAYFGYNSKKRGDPYNAVMAALEFRNVFLRLRRDFVKYCITNNGQDACNIYLKCGMHNGPAFLDYFSRQRIYHNFCRPHTGLPNGITPAQAAGIDLNLGENKIKALIEKSAEAKEQTKRKCNIEVQLGKRIEHVNIVREKDCISIKPKNWIDKSIWREINDILSINGFSWLENGKESEWIKMKEL
jgi:hypothetical protein